MKTILDKKNLFSIFKQDKMVKKTNSRYSPFKLIGAISTKPRNIWRIFLSINNQRYKMEDTVGRGGGRGGTESVTRIVPEMQT